MIKIKADVSRRGFANPLPDLLTGMIMRRVLKKLS